MKNQALAKTVVVDVLSDFWLKIKVNQVIRKGVNDHGVPSMGTLTAYFSGNLPVLVDIEALAALDSQKNNNQEIKFKNDLNAIQAQVKGLSYTNNSHQTPCIEVDYSGKPWISSGEALINDAIKKGERSLPVEVRYFDGGERFDSLWAPEIILDRQKTHQAITASNDDYAHHNHETSLQFG